MERRHIADAAELRGMRVPVHPSGGLGKSSLGLYAALPLGAKSACTPAAPLCNRLTSQSGRSKQAAALFCLARSPELSPIEFSLSEFRTALPAAKASRLEALAIAMPRVIQVVTLLKYTESL